MTSTLCSKQGLVSSNNVLDRSAFLPTIVKNSFQTNNSQSNEFQFQNNPNITQWQESSQQVNGQYYGTNKVNLVIDNGFGNWTSANFGINYAEMCPCLSSNASNCPSTVFTQMANAEGPMGNDGLSNYRFMYCTQNNPPDKYDCKTVFQNTFFSNGSNNSNSANPADFMVFGSLVGNTPVPNSKLFLLGDPIPLDSGNTTKPLFDNVELTHMQLYYLTTPDDGSVTQPCANSLDENTLTGEGSIGRVFQFSPQHGACAMRNVCENGTCQGDFPAKPGDNPTKTLSYNDMVWGNNTQDNMPGNLCYARQAQQSSISFPQEMFGPLNSPTGLNGDPNFVGYGPGTSSEFLNIMNPMMLPFGADPNKSIPDNYTKGSLIRDINADFYNLVPAGYFHWSLTGNAQNVGDWDANYQGLPFSSVTHVLNIYDNPYTMDQIEQWPGPQWSYDISGAGYNPSTQVVSSGGNGDRAVRQYCGSMYGNMGAGQFCKGVNYTSGKYNLPLAPGNNVDFINCTMPSANIHVYSSGSDTFTSVDCSASDDFQNCMNSNDPWTSPYAMYNPQTTDIPIDQNQMPNSILLSQYFTHSASLDYGTLDKSAGDVSNSLQAFWPRSFRGNAGMANPPGYDPKNSTNSKDPFIRKYYNGGQVCSDDGSGNFKCPCYGCKYSGYEQGNYFQHL